MSIGSSLLLTALSIVSPGLGLLGAVVKFVVDEESSPWQLAASFAGALISAEIDLTNDDVPFASRLVAEIPSVALGAVVERAFVGGLGRPTSCSRCGSPTVHVIADANGHPACRACLVGGMSRLHLPSRFIASSNDRSKLWIASPELLSPTVLNIQPKIMSVRLPSSVDRMSAIGVRHFVGVHSNRVSSPRYTSRYLSHLDLR